MTEEDEDNRRRAERVPINEQFGDIRVARTTYVSDLSEHGVFVHTEDKLSIGTTIELRFTVVLDDPVIIEGLGTVVRLSDSPPGLGVEFGPLSPKMVLRIQDALNRQRPLPLKPVEAQGKLTRLSPRDAAFEAATTGAFQAVQAKPIPDPGDSDVDLVLEVEDVDVEPVPDTDGPAKTEAAAPDEERATLGRAEPVSDADLDTVAEPRGGDDDVTAVDEKSPTKLD